MFSGAQTLEKGDTASIILSMFFRDGTRTPVIHKMKETLCNSSNNFQSLTFVKKSSILDLAGVLGPSAVRKVEQNNCF